MWGFPDSSISVRSLIPHKAVRIGNAGERSRRFWHGDLSRHRDAACKAAERIGFPASSKRRLGD